MREGQYAAALAENKRILEEGPASLNDQALYRIALIYTRDENNLRNLYNARDYFSEIINKYPDSSLRSRAKLWVKLINKIESSQKEIADLIRDNDILKNDISNHKIYNTNINIDNTDLKNDSILLKNDIEKKEKRINLLEKKVTELEAQIENLKQIDLGLEQKKSKGVP